MSFSADVKEELIRKYSRSKKCRLAELAGIWAFASRALTRDPETGVYIYTEPGEGKRAVSSDGEGTKKNFTPLRKTFNMKDDFDHSARLGTYTGSVQEKRAFLRGAFLATGTISDPRKDYHFEILAPMEDLAEFVIEQMAAFDIQGRMTKRRGRYPVYLKDSTAIADMLNVMEAHVALMDFENIRIQREMRGSINRKINCDTANINKTVAASMKQTEDIELIRDVLGFDRLSDGLRSICEARLANPDATLEELGELIPVPVGKSGVNHRLRKIGEIADQIRSSADNH